MPDQHDIQNPSDHESDAALLAAAGFTEDPAAHARTSIRTATILAELIDTALSAGEVADLLSVKESRVHQCREDRTLWAMQNHDRWIFPRMQFRPHRQGQGQISGLAQVLPALPADLSPLSIAGFLATPQPDLLAIMPAPAPAIPILPPHGRDLRGATEYVAVQAAPLIWLVNGGPPATVILAASHSESWGVDVDIKTAKNTTHRHFPPLLTIRSAAENIPAARRPGLLAALREANIDFRSGADQRTSAADLQRLLSAAHHLCVVDRPRSNQGRNEMTPRCAGSTSPAAAESDGRARCPYCGHRINVTANGKLFIHNGRRASAPPKARTPSRGAGHQQGTNNNA